MAFTNSPATRITANCNGIIFAKREEVAHCSLEVSSDNWHLPKCAVAGAASGGENERGGNCELSKLTGMPHIVLSCFPDILKIRP